MKRFIEDQNGNIIEDRRGDNNMDFHHLFTEVKIELAKLSTTVEYMLKMVLESKETREKLDQDLKAYVDKTYKDHCEDTDEYIEIGKKAPEYFKKVDVAEIDIKELKSDVNILKNKDKDEALNREKDLKHKLWNIIVPVVLITLLLNIPNILTALSRLL